MAPDPKLEERWISLDESWKEMMVLVNGLSKEQFAWNPPEGGWSIDQVFHHLFKAEEYSFNYLKKKTSGTNTIPQAGIASELKFRALKKALTSRKKWKAPTAVADIPPVEDHDALMKDWENVRNEVKEYVEAMPMERRSAEVYKHPLAGRMSVYRMLDFFNYHSQHHTYQLERILDSMKNV